MASALPFTPAQMLDHSNLQKQAVIITLLFPVLATVVVSLRICLRTATKTFGIDDLFIIVALVFYWANTLCTYMFIKLGYVGYHVWDIPPNHSPILTNKYIFAAELIYEPILTFVRISIMFFLLRLTGPKKAVCRAIWGLVWFTTILTLLNTFLVLFQCLPISDNWDPIQNPKCLNFSAITLAFTIISIVTDAVALVIPTWIVHDLKMPRKQKFFVIGILSFGLITVISGIVRLIILERFYESNPKDITHTVMYTLSTIECGLAFVAACAPHMKPVISYFLPKLFVISSYGRTTPRTSPMIGREVHGGSRHTPKNTTRTKHVPIQIKVTETEPIPSDYNNKKKDGQVKFQEREISEEKRINKSSTMMLPLPVVARV